MHHFQLSTRFAILTIAVCVVASILQVPFLVTHSPYNSNITQTLSWAGLSIFIPVMFINRFIIEVGLGITNDVTGIVLCYIAVLLIFLPVALRHRKAPSFRKSPVLLGCFIIAGYFLISILSLNKLM